MSLRGGHRPGRVRGRSVEGHGEGTDPSVGHRGGVDGPVPAGPVRLDTRGRRPVPLRRFRPGGGRGARPGGHGMSVLLATLCINEMEWLPRLYEQHKDWPGMAGWVFVEAA